MSKKPIYTNFSTEHGKLKVRHVYEDSFEYWGPFAALLLLFVIAFAISGYFFLPQPFEDRLEYLVAPFTLFIAMFTGISRRPVVFMPALIVGCIWGITSLFSPLIHFNVAAYVFCYCSTLTFMILVDVIKGK